MSVFAKKSRENRVSVRHFLVKLNVVPICYRLAGKGPVRKTPAFGSTMHPNWLAGVNREIIRARTAPARRPFRDFGGCAVSILLDQVIFGA